MTLPREEVLAGFADELEHFERLVRSLDDRQWEAPSRCQGWRVADVAAHVIGQLTDVTTGRLEGLGTPEVTEREVVERRGRGPGELADELHAAAQQAASMGAVFDDAAWDAPGPTDAVPTLGEGIEALWYDAWLHADDMRSAAGLPPERGPGLRASVLHLATLLERDGWGPATIAVDGVEEVPVGGGDGPHVTGDARQFVLAATGRADPATVGLDERVNVYR